jgi:3-oxoacyl-ACP reductase-like protein
MSILGSIMSKVFGHSSAAPAAAATPSTAAATPAATPAPAASSASTAAAEMPEVDVEKVLSGMASHSSQKLDWRSSIVDLMKLLGIDSSMVNRRALATELGYTGDLNDSATMNTWLHKAVMRKLAENGGKVPATLLD